MDIISYSQALKAKREWAKVEARIGKNIIGTDTNAHTRINAIQSQAGNLSQSVISEITERNMIQQLKRTLRLESLQASTQHKMHQMIIEYLSDDSSFDATKSSNATFGVNKVEPTNRNSSFTVITEAEEVGTVTSFMFSGGLRGTSSTRTLEIKEFEKKRKVNISVESKEFSVDDNTFPYYFETDFLYLGENFAALQSISYNLSYIDHVELWSSNGWITLQDQEVFNQLNNQVKVRVVPNIAANELLIDNIKISFVISLKEYSSTNSITLSDGFFHNTEMFSGRVRLKKDESRSTSLNTILYKEGYWESAIIDREKLGIDKYLESLNLRSSNNKNKKVWVRESDYEKEIHDENYYELDELLMLKQKHKRFYQVKIKIEAGLDKVSSQFVSYVETNNNTKIEKNALNTKTQYKSKIEKSEYTTHNNESLQKISNYSQNWLRIDKIR